nr:RecName: Full=Cicerin [Cicer arietinum]
ARCENFADSYRQPPISSSQT